MREKLKKSQGSIIIVDQFYKLVYKSRRVVLTI